MNTPPPTADPAICAVMKTLADERYRQRISQAQIGAKIGVSRTQVSRFELCLSMPRISVLQRYARALGMHLTFEVRAAERPSFGMDAAAAEHRVLAP